MGLFY